METIRHLPTAVTPCPACGGQPKHVKDNRRMTWHFECPPCHARTHRYTTASEALNAGERMAAMEAAA